MNKAKGNPALNENSNGTRIAETKTLVAVLSHVKIGFSIFDHQSRLVTCNEHFVELFRLPPDSARPGTSLRTVQRIAVKLFLSDDTEQRNLLRKWRKEYYSKIPSKTFMPLLDGRIICRRYCPFEQGGFITIYEDVTEAIYISTEFRRARALLDAVLENVPAAILVKDAEERRFSIVSREAGRLFGLTAGEMIGKTADEVFLKQVADDFKSGDNQALLSSDGQILTESRFDTPNRGMRDIVSKRIVLWDGLGHPQFIVLVIHDRTEVMETVRELERSRNFLNAVLDKVPIGIVAVELSTSRFQFVNRAAATIVGAPVEAFVGKTVREGLAPETADYVEPLLAEAFYLYPKPWVRELMFPWNDKILPLRVEVVFLKDKNDEPEFYIVAFENLTERIEKERELTRSRNFLNTIIDNIPFSISVNDLTTRRTIIANEAAAKVTGLTAKSIIGKSSHDLYPRETAEFFDAFVQDALRTHPAPWVREVELFFGPDGPRTYRGKIIILEDDAGVPSFLIGVGEDITDEKLTAQRIDFLAHHDTLTQLPNRVALNQQLQKTIVEAVQKKDEFAVLSVDIDRFNEFNDLFGVTIGDDLLRKISERLREYAADVFVARSDGDQFTLLTPFGPQPTTAEVLVGRIRDALKYHFEIEGHRLSVDVSMGIAVFPADGTDADAVLACADAALFQAKEEGRSAFRFFDSEMDRQIRNRHALLQDLRESLSREQFVLHFQPQARIGGEIIGFEALIRWQHPERGLVPPSGFIPLAEEYGHIVAIGEWTLRQACREAASWKAPLQIAVNLSPAQFGCDRLLAGLSEVLVETGLNPGRLELEITEGVLISDPVRTISILQRLKALGVKIVMDDFGTGYSSLSYLQSFPFDKIKIDKSFIMSLHKNPQAATIVRAVIWMAHSLAMPVIAEGVETPEQLAFLTRESCDDVQGFLIGKPCPITEYASVTNVISAITERLPRNNHRLLTPREREVLQLLAEGKSSKEVASILGTSTSTVEVQRSNLMQKLNIHSIAHLVRYAIREHIISP
jgi:diguanylate cyclase (GGDEF)-like protein/PAS domain S-box-containing protein